MKAVLERNLWFVVYPEYSVDTDGNVWALNYKCSKGKGDTKRRMIDFTLLFFYYFIVEYNALPLAFLHLRICLRLFFSL